MSYQISLALFLVPLPAMVWYVGDMLAEMLPRLWHELRLLVRWGSRFLALLTQVGLLAVAQQIATSGGASANILGVLTAIVQAGFVATWAAGFSLVLFMLYLVYAFAKRRLEEAGHVLRLKN